MNAIDWNAVIEDAKGRLDWVASQTTDPDVQSMLLQQSGEAAPVPMVERTPEPLRRERMAAVRSLRLARFLGARKGKRWAERPSGQRGEFNPAAVTETEAAAVLVVVRSFVRRHSQPLSPHPLSEEGRDDVASQIVANVFTRDYEGSGVDSLAAAVWQACGLWRRCGWRCDPTSWNERRRQARAAAKGDHPNPNERTCQGGGSDNPARIAAAIEAAAGGLWAVSVQNRGRVAKRATRGGKRMPGMAAADARLCLLGVGE